MAHTPEHGESSGPAAAAPASPSADVAVIGGGLVGMAFAAAVARAGLRTVVIERGDPAEFVAAPYDGRASAIAFASQRLLDAAGLWHAMAAHAEPIVEIRVSDGASPLFLHYDHADLGEGALGYMVENRHTREALYARARRLPDLLLLTGATVETVDPGEGQASVRLADGRRIDAALLVGADGVRSRTREGAGIKTYGWTYHQTGIVCTVHHQRPHNGVAHEHFLPAGPFAILPLKGNRSSLVWTEREDLAPGMMALDDDAFLAEVAARFGDFLGTLKLEGPRWSYPLGLQHAERYTAPRLALIGDAAHGIHPIAGQGLNLGLRDVAALAEVLVDARRLGLDIGGAQVLSRYERWRRVDTMLMLSVTDALNRLFSNDIAPVQLARDLGLAAVNKLPSLKRFFMAHARGTVGSLPRLLRGLPL
ncbi:MAG TPA: UbiH/UbiF/VisC/COQ6 family ubiquinone biosynthesis hydroxylase [Alphaproteobacteria bacterium]|nr:UbiH/UbiF/VisC/COQ6 family ubiquinone biosynthesis hydroxylase [Alphaproteobacteria bacterium]